MIASRGIPEPEEAYRRDLRASIARELHDGPINVLTECVLKLERYRLLSDNPDMQSAIGQIEGDARVALTSLRNMIRDLRGDAARGDLASAARTMASRHQASTGTEVTVVTSPTWPELVPAQVRLNLLRIMQEALTNAIRHGSADHVLLELNADDDRLLVTIADDGLGIPDDSPAGSGLLGMRERATLLGGSLTIRRRLVGTEVRVEVPRP